MKKLPELTKYLILKTKNSHLRRDFGGQVGLKTFVLGSLFLVLCFALLGSVHAQEVEVPGPDLEDASFIEVKDLKVGDWVFVKNETGDLIPETITKLDYQPEPVDVYNLSVDGKETFFANDFGVHNKGGGPRPPDYCGIRLSQRIAVNTANYVPSQESNPNQTDQVLVDEELITRTGRQAFENGWIPFDLGASEQVCYFGFSNQTNDWESVPGWPCNGSFCSTRPSGVPSRPNYQTTGGACPGASGLDWYKATCSVSGKWGCPYDGDPPPPPPDHRKYLNYEGNFFILYPGSVLAINNIPSGRLIFKIEFNHKRLDGAPEINLYRHGASFGSPYNSLKEVRGTGSKTVYLRPASEALYFYHTEETGSMLIYNIEITLIKVNGAEGAEGNYTYLTGAWDETEEVTEESSNLVAAVDNSIGGLGSGYISQGIGRVSLSNLSSSGPWTKIIDRSSGDIGEWTPTYDEDTLHGFNWDICEGREGDCSGTGSRSLQVWIKVCGITSSADECTVCSDTIDFTPNEPSTGTVNGTVYDITGSGESCPLDGDTLSGGTVQIAGYGTQTPNPDYQFTDLPVGEPLTVMMTGFPDGYSDPYYCDGDDNNNATVTLSGDGDVKTVNIGLTSTIGAWFQTKDGDVHAEGVLSNPLPAGEHCSLVGDGDSPGVISYGTSCSFGNDSASEEGWLTNSSDGGLTYGYDYFDHLISSPESLSENPSIDDLNALDGFYKVEGDGNLSLPESSWNVNSSGQKVVILVPGNLTIKERINLGTNNNFLAFIVGEDITIEGDVTDAGVNPALEGILIADGTIEIESSANVFTGKGMFVGWEGFSLGRDLEGDNGDTPAETFIFSPELWINTPLEIQQASYTWQEIAP